MVVCSYRCALGTWKERLIERTEDRNNEGMWEGRGETKQEGKIEEWNSTCEERKKETEEELV